MYCPLCSVSNRQASFSRSIFWPQILGRKLLIYLALSDPLNEFLLDYQIWSRTWASLNKRFRLSVSCSFVGCRRRTASYQAAPAKIPALIGFLFVVPTPLDWASSTPHLGTPCTLSTPPFTNNKIKRPDKPRTIFSLTPRTCDKSCRMQAEVAHSFGVLARPWPLSQKKIFKLPRIAEDYSAVPRTISCRMPIGSSTSACRP